TVTTHFVASEGTSPAAVHAKTTYRPGFAAQKSAVFPSGNGARSASSEASTQRTSLPSVVAASFTSRPGWALTSAGSVTTGAAGSPGIPHRGMLSPMKTTLTLAAVLALAAAAPAADDKPMDTSFLKLYAETRGFMLGRPQKPKITPDGKAVLFLRAEAKTPRM